MLRVITLLFALIIIPSAALAGDSPSPEDVNNRIFAEARRNVKLVSAATLKSWVEEDKDFLLLDVREPSEVEAARIDAPRQVAIPRGVVEFVFPRREEEPGTTVVVYCLVGNRSALVADLLTRYGYTDVYNLDGGIMSWVAEGYPVTNFIGSFSMKDVDSVWMKPPSKASPATKK